MPTDTLTREQIVRAAIALLDDEGLEGLNMRALGQRLDSAATAMYWHVESKSNLIALAADQLWDEIGLPDLSVVDWRTAATAMARDLHAMLTRHSWLMQVLGSYVVYGAGKARHDDHSLAIYESAGFKGARADRAAVSVFTFVLGNALGQAAAAALARKVGRDGGDAKKRMRESLARARKIAVEFPRLRARLDGATAEYGATPDGSFEFGLQSLLDGLEAQLTTRARRNPRTGSRDRGAIR